MNKKAGPWDIPIKDFVKEFKLMVVIYNIKTDHIEYEHEIDYGKYEDRKFLGRLTYWAASNDRSIETMSLANWKKVNNEAGVRK